MSIHPSLRSKSTAATLRNVLKRHERVRHFMEQGTWVEGQSVLGLPKIKQTKLKAKKAAPKEKEAEAASSSDSTTSASPSA